MWIKHDEVCLIHHDKITNRHAGMANVFVKQTSGEFLFLKSLRNILFGNLAMACVWSSCWKMGSSFVLVDRLARWLNTCQFSATYSADTRKTKFSLSQLLMSLNASNGSWDDAGQSHKKGREEADKGRALSSAEATVQVWPDIRGYDMTHSLFNAMSEGRELNPQKCDEWLASVHWLGSDKEWKKAGFICGGATTADHGWVCICTVS